MLRIIKTPSILNYVFPNFLWRIKTSKKVIYLTFDDGPTPEVTEQVLTYLEQYNAKATFFCIGKNIQENPSIFEQIIKSGHSIGNHTFNHVKGRKVRTKYYLDNTLKAEKVIQKFKNQITNLQPSNVHLFRPPYGSIKLSQAKQLRAHNYKIVMWDVLSYDWDASISGEQIVNNIITYTKPGSIVVFHDSKKASKNMLYALPEVLKHFSSKGYYFEKIHS